MSDLRRGGTRVSDGSVVFWRVSSKEMLHLGYEEEFMVSPDLTEEEVSLAVRYLFDVEQNRLRLVRHLTPELVEGIKILASLDEAGLSSTRGSHDHLFRDLTNNPETGLQSLKNFLSHERVWLEAEKKKQGPVGREAVELAYGWGEYAARGYSTYSTPKIDEDFPLALFRALTQRQRQWIFDLFTPLGGSSTYTLGSETLHLILDLLAPRPHLVGGASQHLTLCDLLTEAGEEDLLTVAGGFSFAHTPTGRFKTSNGLLLALALLGIAVSYPLADLDAALIEAYRMDVYFVEDYVQLVKLQLENPGMPGELLRPLL